LASGGLLLWLSPADALDETTQGRDERFVAANLEKLKGQSERERRFAILYLMRTDPPDVDSLREVLKGGKLTPLARAGAAESLGYVSGQEARPAVRDLAAALSDPDELIRIYAAEALGSIGKEAADAVAQLKDALGDREVLVRHFAAAALGSIGPDAKAAVVPLRDLLNDRDPVIRYQAAMALGLVGPEASAAFLELKRALKREKNRFALTGIAEGLGGLRESALGAVQDLREVMLDRQADVSVRASAARGLGYIGPKVVEGADALVDDLKKALADDEQVSSNAAGALGEMGDEARTAIRDLAAALKGGSDEVRADAGEAIGNIADSLWKVRYALPIKDLGSVIADLGEAAKAIEGAAFDEDRKKYLKNRIHDPLDALREAQRSRFWERVAQVISEHPAPFWLIAYIVSMLIVWTVLLRWRPLWVLWLNDAMKPYDLKLPDALGGFKVSLRTLLLVEFFHHHRLVLDKWVAVHLDQVKESFLGRETVLERSIHVQAPVDLTIGTSTKPGIFLTSRHLRNTFSGRRGCLLIWGEGGAGKTSLACKVARWAMGEEGEHLTEHLMLPVLIEQELTTSTRGGGGAGGNVVDENKRSSDEGGAKKRFPLGDAIRGQLQLMIGETDPIPEDLFERLLRERRVLVIVDHLSEMSGATRALFRPEDPDFPVNALIITSRIKEGLGSAPNMIIHPLRIQGDRLSSFMDSYLRALSGRNGGDAQEPFDRDDIKDTTFFDACRRLASMVDSSMVDGRNLTVLMAKMYTDLLIDALGRAGDGADPLRLLPVTIPEMMLRYVSYLNRSRDEAAGDPDNATVQADAKAIAWDCLRRTYQPGSAAPREVVLATIGGHNAEGRLNYLERRLHLIQVEGADEGRRQVKFTLDPLSEYLAGMRLIDLGEMRLTDPNGQGAPYDQAKEFWEGILKSANATIAEAARLAIRNGHNSREVMRAQRAGQPIRGLLVAIRDCCAAKLNDRNITTEEVKALDFALAGIKGLVESADDSSIAA
jgi:HEAT repeat protein